jgi:hypothetical protein
VSRPKLSIGHADATPVGVAITGAAEFAFIDYPGHPRGCVTLLLSLALVGAISPPEPGTAETVPVATETPRHDESIAPGGYWTLAEQHERSREPPDGEDELTIGSVLFSLGFLRAGAGVLTALMADDLELCPLTEPRGCSGLRNYGWAGVAEGGLMLGTGITYLAIGATRRQRHRRWERGEPLASLRPGAALSIVDVGAWVIPRSARGISEVRVGGAGLCLQLRF